MSSRTGCSRDGNGSLPEHGKRRPIPVLKHRREFLEVFRTGKKFDGPHFILYVLERPGASSQAGISVSRKVGGAVVRNRQRRRVREVLRLNQHRLKTCSQVVVLKPSSADLNTETCRNDLERLWDRAGITGDRDQ